MLTTNILEEWIDGDEPEQSDIFTWAYSVLKWEKVEDYLKQDNVKEAIKAYKGYRGQVGDPLPRKAVV